MTRTYQKLPGNFIEQNEAFIKDEMIKGVTLKKIAKQLCVPLATFVTLLDISGISPIRVRRDHREANPHLFKHQQYSDWGPYKKTWKARMPAIIKMLENCVGIEQVAEHYRTSAGTISNALKSHGTSVRKVKDDKAKSYMEGLKNEAQQKAQS